MDNVLTLIFRILFGTIAYITGIGTIPQSWNQGMTLVDHFLSLDIFSWISKGGSAISGALLPISTGFVILFWMYGLLKAEATLVDMKRPETLFKHLIRLAVAVFLINAIPGIIENVWTIGVNLGTIVGNAFKTTANTGSAYNPLNPSLNAPGSVSSSLFSDYLSYDAATFQKDQEEISQIFGAGNVSISYMIWSFILGWVITIGTRIAIIYVVYDILTSVISRAFRLFLLYAVSPVAASAVASEETQRVTFQFFKNAIAVSSEIAVTEILLSIFPVIVSALFSQSGLVNNVITVAAAIVAPALSQEGTVVTLANGLSLNAALSNGLGCALLFLVCIFTLKASIKGMNNILDSLFGLHGV